MASSLLEQTREAHEEVERLERLVVTDFRADAVTHKERLLQNHRVPASWMRWSSDGHENQAPGSSLPTTATDYRSLPTTAANTTWCPCAGSLSALLHRAPLLHHLDPSALWVVPIPASLLACAGIGKQICHWWMDLAHERRTDPRGYRRALAPALRRGAQRVLVCARVREDTLLYDLVVIHK